MWPEPRAESTEAWDALAIRFAAHAPGVSSALIGTGNTDHLAHAVAHVAQGPLEGDRLRELGKLFERPGRDWEGVV